MPMSTCKADDCNTVVADPNQDFCRSCRAKLSAAAQEMKKSAGVYQPLPSQPVAAASDTDPDDLLSLGDLDDGIVSPLPPGPLVAVNPRHLPKAEQGYLPFPKPMVMGRSSWTIQAQPQVIFRASALMLWGFDDSTVIDAVYVGPMVQGVACFGEIPASFFGTAKSYEKLVEDFEKNGISPPGWITWSTCQVGALMSIRGKGPLSHAVALGKIAY